MATYTTNYNLKLPALTDTYRTMNQNDNMTIIDEVLHDLNTGKISKIVSPVANNIAKLDANGNVIDSGKSIDTIPTVDSALSDSSTNPVQNKIIKVALDGKVNTVVNKGLSTNDFTDILKTKLDGIATGATNTVIDTALSGSSINPVQNKIVKVALDSKENKHSTVAATLTTAGWSSNSQSVAVIGVTASNTVIVAPSLDSQEDYLKSGIICTTQAANSLTFTYKVIPTVAMTVNVVILGG